MINGHFSAVSILENPYIEEKKLYKLNSITDKLRAIEMSNNPNLQIPDLKYKTELCRTWVEQNYCPYMDKCRFAHGKHDLQDKIIFGKNYKQKDCKSFHSKGYCPYGPRCLFRHDERKFSDLKRPFYKYILENNFSNIHLRNLNLNGNFKFSEDEMTNDIKSETITKIRDVDYNSKFYFGFKEEQNPFSNTKHNCTLGDYSNNSQNRKNSEFESSYDLAGYNYNSKKTKLYKPRLSVFERFHPQADSISFESTDVDIDFDTSEKTFISKAKKIGNKCKTNFDVNGSNIITTGKLFDDNGKNNSSFYSTNANSSFNMASNCVSNLAYFDKPADKNINIGNINYNSNNIGYNCQKKIPISNNSNNNSNNVTNNFINYNNNLLSSFAVNVRNNAHLHNRKNPNVNFPNINKNKFSILNSNVFNNFNSVSIQNKNQLLNPMIQNISNKNKCNKADSFSIDTNRFYEKPKTTNFREDNLVNKENVNPNIIKKSDDRKNLNTLNTNHMPFYPSPKKEIILSNINKDFIERKNKENILNFQEENNLNDKIHISHYGDNYHKIFSNSNLNFEFFGESSSEDKGENLSNTSNLSTENSHFNESIPNSFFNEIENLNDNSNFYNYSNNQINSQKTVNTANENWDFDFFCSEQTKQNPKTLDDFSHCVIERKFCAH